MKEIEKKILQLAHGDRGALELLYERTKGAVYGLALSIVRNPQDAEDIMQDTYLRIYRSSGSYRARGKPMAWILTITRNLAMDKVRSRTARELPLEEDWIPDKGSDFSESALDRMVLDSLLARLTEEERQIVVLYTAGRLKHREIARILGIPLGTSLSKYHRSLSKLRKWLEEEQK